MTIISEEMLEQLSRDYTFENISNDESKENLNDGTNKSLTESSLESKAKMFMFDTVRGEVFLQPDINKFDDKGIYRWDLSIAK